jgi:hypothetical protein
VEAVGAGGEATGSAVRGDDGRRRWKQRLGCSESRREMSK